MVEFMCNNFFQLCADHHVDAPHETPHLYDSDGEFDPYKVGPHEVVFVKTDFLDQFLDVARPHVKAPFMLITGHSDLSPSARAVEQIMMDADISTWYAQNTSIENFKLRAIPIGFSEPSREFGNQDVIAAACEKFSKFSSKVSALAAPTAARRGCVGPVGGAAIERLRTEDVAPCFSVAEGKMPFDEYLSFIGRHEFCLVPRGNAIDTHRFYECIVTRTVPVVISDEVPAFYNRFPMIVLQPRGEESVYDVLRRFAEELRAGLTPALPTAEEWDGYIEAIRVDSLKRII